MSASSILVSTYGGGVHLVTGGVVAAELAGHTVVGLVGDGHGGVLAVVDGHAVYRRAVDGRAWTELAKLDAAISCCVPISDAVFVGTDDARVIRIDADGGQHDLAGLAATAGRDTWYAGTAIVDGRLVGPPLGIRSIAATCDGGALLANVHVGGIPRSADRGATWAPTIAVDSDVHQVCAHPTRPELVIAATAAGLGVSRDAGATWTLETRGLHALHCAAVAFGRDDILISAATEQFASHGAVYRRPIDGDGPLEPVAGLPRWTAHIADTRCIAAGGSTLAVIDGAGRLYVSADDGGSWAAPVARIADPSGVYVF